MITRLSFALLVIFLFASNALAMDTCRVFFKDKGLSQIDLTPGSARFEATLAALSEASIDRRRKAAGAVHDWQVISSEDYKVNEQYLQEIHEVGATVIQTSKWMNFATVACSPEVRSHLQQLPFVDRVVKLGRVKTVLAEEVCGADTIIYHRGLASWQLDRINTGPMHWLGIDATGVAIAYFDTGFIWRDNPAIDHLNVIGEYDFVAKDSVTSMQIGDHPGQWDHGTHVLAVAAALVPDTTIGPAFNADIVLGKTENLYSETPLEEENYALALEWAEGLGARIASSSLGYIFFDSGFTSYTYDDLDGETAISSKAAARAAKLGMLIVTAAGNDGNKPFPYINAPADADSILAVGAYFFNDTIVDFSSRGPTADGRIKPDISAPGVGVWSYNPFVGPVAVSGTSHATPLVSSSAALIMQAHPQASAQEIREAILATGSNAASPDTMAGWGMLNTYAAALKIGPFFGKISQKFTENHLELCVGFASGAETNNIIFRYRKNRGEFLDLPLNESTDSNYYTLSQIFGGKPGDTLQYYIIATTSNNDTLILPKGAPEAAYQLAIGDTVIGMAGVDNASASLSRATVYPNPATQFVEVASEKVILSAEILDIAGRYVMTSSSTTQHSKRFLVNELASGSYLVRLTFTDGSQETHQLRIAR